MRTPFLLVAALALPGCFMEGYSMKDRVTEAAKKYNEGVQWNRLEQSVAYLPKDEQHPFVERMSALEDDLEIAEMDMVSLDVDKKRDRATARMTYTWSLKRQGLLVKTVTEQTWAEKSGKWQMLHEVRLRGAPLVIFKERSEVPEDKPEDEKPSKFVSSTAGGPSPGTN